MKTYQVIARTLGALDRCAKSNNTEWVVKHGERLAELLEGFPSSSGFDNGTKLDDDSTSERLVFNTSFHHMDENGFYCGWTEHQVIVTPSLEMGCSIRVTGRDKREIKEYIGEMFSSCLDNDRPEYAQAHSLDSFAATA